MGSMPVCRVGDVLCAVEWLCVCLCAGSSGHCLGLCVCVSVCGFWGCVWVCCVGAWVLDIEEWLWGM